jgi:hypothetical protein
MNVDVTPLLAPSKYTYPYPCNVWIHMPRVCFNADFESNNLVNSSVE